MMRKLVLVGAAVLAMAVPSASRAQVSLGARVGYAFGMGDVGADSGQKIKMTDWIKGQIPIQVDAMYRLTPELALGGFFSYGFGMTGGDLKDQICDVPGVDCTASIMRAGVQGTFTFAMPSPFVPWAGIGVGYEWSKLHLKGGGESGDIKFRGWEFVNLQIGGDFKAGPFFRVGPFAMLSLGQYSEVDTTGVAAGEGPSSIPDKKLHEWLQIGIRGMFDI